MISAGCAVHGAARAPGSDKDGKIPVENDGSARNRASADTPAYAHAAGVSLHPTISVCSCRTRARLCTICFASSSSPPFCSARSPYFFLNYLQRCGKIVTLDTGVCISCWQALSELASRACLAVCRHVVGCRSLGFLGGMDRRRTRWRGNRARAQARTGLPACARKHPRFACMGRLQTHSERADITGEREINLTVWRQLESAQEKKKW